MPPGHAAGSKVSQPSSQRNSPPHSRRSSPTNSPLHTSRGHLGQAASRSALQPPAGGGASNEHTGAAGPASRGGVASKVTSSSSSGTKAMQSRGAATARGVDTFAPHPAMGLAEVARAKASRPGRRTLPVQRAPASPTSENGTAAFGAAITTPPQVHRIPPSPQSTRCHNSKRPSAITTPAASPSASPGASPRPSPRSSCSGTTTSAASNGGGSGGPGEWQRRVVPAAAGGRAAAALAKALGRRNSGQPQANPHRSALGVRQRGQPHTPASMPLSPVGTPGHRTPQAGILSLSQTFSSPSGSVSLATGGEHSGCLLRSAASPTGAVTDTSFQDYSELHAAASIDRPSLSPPVSDVEELELSHGAAEADPDAEADPSELCSSASSLVRMSCGALKSLPAAKEAIAMHGSSNQENAGINNVSDVWLWPQTGAAWPSHGAEERLDEACVTPGGSACDSVALAAALASRCRAAQNTPTGTSAANAAALGTETSTGAAVAFPAGGAAAGCAAYRVVAGARSAGTPKGPPQVVHHCRLEGISSGPVGLPSSGAVIASMTPPSSPSTRGASTPEVCDPPVSSRHRSSPSSPFLPAMTVCDDGEGPPVASLVATVPLVVPPQRPVECTESPAGDFSLAIGPQGVSTGQSNVCSNEDASSISTSWALGSTTASSAGGISGNSTGSGMPPRVLSAAAAAAAAAASLGQAAPSSGSSPVASPGCSRPCSADARHLVSRWATASVCTAAPPPKPRQSSHLPPPPPPSLSGRRSGGVHLAHSASSPAIRVPVGSGSAARGGAGAAKVAAKVASGHGSAATPARSVATAAAASAAAAVVARAGVAAPGMGAGSVRPGAGPGRGPPSPSGGGGTAGSSEGGAAAAATAAAAAAVATASPTPSVSGRLLPAAGTAMAARSAPLGPSPAPSSSGTPTRASAVAPVPVSTAPPVALLRAVLRPQSLGSRGVPQRGRAGAEVFCAASRTVTPVGSRSPSPVSSRYTMGLPPRLLSSHLSHSHHAPAVSSPVGTPTGAKAVSSPCSVPVSVSGPPTQAGGSGSFPAASHLHSHHSSMSLVIPQHGASSAVHSPNPNEATSEEPSSVICPGNSKAVYTSGAHVGAVTSMVKVSPQLVVGVLQAGGAAVQVPAATRCWVSFGS